MTLRDKALLSALIWAFVFPGVLLVSYAMEWMQLGWPMWLEIMVSTALTVPLISVVAAPLVERIVAATRGETAAEMKIEQAREAPGPSPEEVLSQ